MIRACLMKYITHVPLSLIHICRKATAAKKKQELAGDGVKAHGKLSVKGIDLTDKNGDKVQLRGMSSHGLLWYPEYTNYASIYETKKHGANMFRIAMYSDDGNGDGGYIQNPELSWKLMQACLLYTSSEAWETDI